MITLGTQRWTNENPAIYLTFAYEKQRVGAAMQYMVQVSVSPVTGASSFGYDMWLNVFLDGAHVQNVQLKPNLPAQWSSPRVWTSGWFTVANKTTGTTTVAFGVYSTGGAKRSGTYSYAMAVDPAASTLSASSGTLGQAQTLTLTRYSAVFKDTVTWTCGTASGTIATLSQETQFSFIPPLDLASQAPTSAAVEIRYTVATYQADGVTLVATSSTVAAAVIPASVKPSCALAVSDATGAFAKYGAYVQGQSKFALVVTPTTAYGSEIASYQITADGKTYTQADVTTDAIAGNGELTLTARVTDRRGRTSDATSQTVQVLPCRAPVISAYSARRCGSDGTPDEEGLYIKVAFSAEISPLNDINTAEYSVKYRVAGTEDWTSLPLSNYEGQYSVTDGSAVFAAAAANAWDVQIAAKDDFAETAQTRSVAIAFSLVNYNSSGKGLAFGRISQLEDEMEIDMPVRMYQALQVNSIDLAAPLSIPCGGTGANAVDEARRNLSAMTRPKLLWSGAWASGSILLPALADYEMFVLVINSSLYPLPMLMVKSPNSTGNPIIWTGSGALDANVPAQQQRSFGVELQCNTTGYVYASQKNTMVHIGGGAHVGPSADPWDILRLYGLVLTSDLAQEDT